MPLHTEVVAIDGSFPIGVIIADDGQPAYAWPVEHTVTGGSNATSAVR